MIWFRKEAYPIKQGLNLSWIRGPEIILRIGKWKGRVRYRIKLKPHWIFGSEYYSIKTDWKTVVNTKVKSSPIHRK